MSEILSHDIELTVVVPLYNKKQTIHRAIQSVLSQLDDRDQIIVVDDGSTDGGADVVRSITDPRLFLISQDNQGVSAARNRGIDAAQTEHVAFLDADDWWLSGAVSEFKKMIRDCPECVMYCVGHVRCAPGETLEYFQESPVVNSEILEGPEFINLYSRQQLINSSASCVKKKLAQKIGGFPVKARSGEDIYLWLRMALLGCVVVSRQLHVVVERPAPGVGRPQRDPVPYYVRWFSDPNRVKVFSKGERGAISRFLLYRGMNMCAGKVVAKRRGDAIQICRAIIRVRPFFLFVGVTIITMPAFVFRIGYKIKNAATIQALRGGARC